MAIVGFASFGGGYFPRSWGIGAALLAAVAAAAVYRGCRIGRLERAFALGIVAVLVLTAISLSWTESVTLTMLDLERTLVYAAFVGAAVLLVRRSSELVVALVGAAMVVTSWAITEHLLLDRDIDEFQGALLTGSLGYANALAAIGAMGAVAAASCSVNGRRSWVWAAGAQVMLAAVALSGSRGGAVAWAAGAVVAVILARTRLRLSFLLAYLSLTSTGIGLTARATGVTRASVSTSDVVREARLLFLLICVAAITAAIAARLTRRLPETQDRRLAGLAAIVLGSVIVLAGLAQPGLGDRRAYWEVAVEAFGERSLLGHGPGTYERLWLERRPVLREVRDAHSLYLETFAEQGLVGGVLLVSVVALPLVAAARSSRGVVPSAAVGAYTTFLVHAGIDWDWELPAVTCAGLVAGVACLKLPQDDPPWPLGSKTRIGLVAMLAVVALGSLYALAGNWKVMTARDQMLKGRAASALVTSSSAMGLQPWSSEPLMVDAQSRLMLGDRRGARNSLVKAISRDPTNWLAWWLLSVSSESANERQLAATHAARLNPLWAPVSDLP